MVNSVLSLSAVASMFPSLMLRPSFPDAEVGEVGAGP